MDTETLVGNLVFSPKSAKLAQCELSTLLTQYSTGKLSDRLEYSDDEVQLLYQRYSRAYFDDEKVYNVFAVSFMDRAMHREALSCLYSRLYLLEKGSKDFSDTLKMVNSVEESLVSQILPLPPSFVEDMFFRRPNFNFSTWKSKMGYSDDLTPYSYGSFVQDGSITSVSTRSLRPGDLIFKVTPFVVAPWDIGSRVLSDPSLSRENTYCCFHCLSVVNKSFDSLRDSGTLIACSRHPRECNFYFCSRQCFLNNGAVHALECDHLMKLVKFSESFLSPSLVLLVFRTLIKCSFTMDSYSRVCEISEDSSSTTSNEVLDTLLNINIDYSILSLYHPYIIDHADRFASFLLEEVGFDLCLHLTSRELKHLTLALWVNSVPFTSYLNYSFESLSNTMGGTAFSFKPLQFRQSSTPNCVFHFDDEGKLTLRAIYEIPSGCELTFNSYIDKYLPPFIQNTRFWSSCSLFFYNPREFEYFRDSCSIRCKNCVNAFCHSVNYLGLVDSEIQDNPFEFTQVFEGITWDNNNNNNDNNNCNSNNNNNNYNKHGNVPFLRYQWKCQRCCSPTSEDLDLLFNKAQNVFVEALRMYFRGEFLVCKSMLVDFVTKWSGVLHPCHYLLYNSYLLLSGILMNKPGGNLFDSLGYFRKAIIASDSLLPGVCHEKAYLYERFADYLLKMKVYCRLGKEEYRGLKVTIMDALYNSLWNWTVISGSSSYQSVMAMQKCRSVAFSLNIHAFPLSRKLVVNPTAKYFEVYAAATGSKVIPQGLVDKLNNNTSSFVESNLGSCVAKVRESSGNNQSLQTSGNSELSRSSQDSNNYQGLQTSGSSADYPGLQSSGGGEIWDFYTDSDIASIPFVAAQSGECSEEVVGVLNSVQSNCLFHLGTGLSILGIAASNLNSDLFSGLVSSLYDSVVKHLEFISESSVGSEEVSKPEFYLSSLLYSFFGPNELGIDPLIALASAPYPVGVSSWDSDLSVFVTREMSIARVIFSYCSKLSNLLRSYRLKISSEVVSADFFKFLSSESDFRSSVLNRGTHSSLRCQTALHYSASKGKRGLTEYLLRQGFHVDVLNLDGVSPLHLAAYHGHSEVVKTLVVSFKANIFITLKTGETPLHLAVYGLHKDTVLALLEFYRGHTFEGYGPSVWHSLVCGLFSENVKESEGLGFGEVNARELLSERLSKAVEICKILMEEVESEKMLRIGIWADFLPSQLLVDLWSRYFEGNSLFKFPKTPPSIYVISKPRGLMEKPLKGFSNLDLEGHTGLYGSLKESKYEVNNYRDLNDQNDSIFIATRTYQFLVEILKNLEEKYAYRV